MSVISWAIRVCSLCPLVRHEMRVVPRNCGCSVPLWSVTRSSGRPVAYIRQANSSKASSPVGISRCSDQPFGDGIQAIRRRPLGNRTLEHSRGLQHSADRDCQETPALIGSSPTPRTRGATERALAAPRPMSPVAPKCVRARRRSPPPRRPSRPFRQRLAKPDRA
jgi:hypothetical protein